MAGGKSTKRVNLRSKIARKQQAQRTGATSAAAGADASSANEFSNPSASSSVRTEGIKAAAAATSTAADAPYGHNQEDRQTALRIRDALRQRQGRSVATAASVNATSGSTVALKRKKVEDRLSSKRLSAKKESRKDTAATHPAALRRAAAHERRHLLLPPMSAAEARMAAAKEELKLFEKVQAVPSYAADPFAAVMQHLSTTMDTLKPQTPDVGRASRD